MKFFSTLASCALLASTVAAVPTPTLSERNWQSCLSRDYIAGLIDKEIIFLYHTDKAAATAIGYEIFDANINEFGDSINSLRMAPVSFESCLLATQTILLATNH